MAVTRSRKKRRRRDRGRFGALYKLALFILIPACIIAGCAIFFRVGQLQITGIQRYSDAEVTQAAGIGLGENLLFLNKQAIEQKIMTNLPYVEGVDVVRNFPDVLQINITESAPAAAIEGENGWWLLNHNCKLLEQVDSSSTEGCFTITGLSALAPAAGTTLVVAEDQRTKLAALKELMAALEDGDMLSKVTTIDLSSDYLVEMGYTEYFQVKMPLVSDFAYMIKRLDLSSSNEKIVQNAYYTVDMTIEGEIHYIPQ